LDGSASFARKADQLATPASSTCHILPPNTSTSLTYHWSLIGQPEGSNPEITDVNAVNPRLKTDVAGTYRLKLEVSTQDGNTNSTEVEIEVDPQYLGPNIQVDAGKDQSVGTNSNVTINEGNSTVINGNNITYQWITVNTLPSPTVINNITNIINIETNEYQSLQFSPDVAGDYQFRLIVKNDEGTTSEDEISIKVDAGKNSIPVADSGKDRHHLINDTVNLSAANSYDADSDVLSYQWFFSAKPGSSQATLDSTDAQDVSFIPDVEGTYVATLRVGDGKETSGDNISSTFDSVMIIVTEGNNVPVAVAGANFSLMVGKTTQLHAGGSYDLDGDNLSYQWSVESFPVGGTYILTNETTLSPSFTPDMKGSYVIQLIVTDSNNYASEPATITATVDETTDTVAPVTTASLQGGSYDSAQTVELICSDNDGSGCKSTYFTIDGSEPSIDSEEYSTSIDVDEDMTLKYFSVDNADNVEAVNTQEYIINIPTSYTLVVNKNDMAGIVKSDVVGIDCGESCSAEFPPNTEIVLTATHPSGLKPQWTDCVSTTINECTLTLSSDSRVEVMFVSTLSETESNNSFTEANLIETSNNITGFFNSADDEDYYKIEVTESGTFYASISHIEISSAMYLYNNLQKELTSTGWAKAHAITYSLTPGTYYIRLISQGTGFDLESTYNLELSGTVLGSSSPDSHEENDSIDTASTIVSKGSYQGYFDTQNDNDYYTFEVTAAGTFYATVSHNSVSSAMYLYNNLQKELTSTGWAKAHAITYSLTPGTYYIRLIPQGTGFDLGSAYNLELSGTVLGSSSPDSYEENDSIDTASTIVSKGLYQGYFDTQNDNDYYTFKVTAAGTFYATISHNSVSSAMYLYNNLQKELTSTGWAKAHTITYSLTPGTYYIRLISQGTGYDLSSAYNFELSITE